MQPKTIVWIGVFVGSTIGSYIPVLLWGAGVFSLSSMLFGGVGAFVGIWVAWTLNQRYF
jgi:hypothetical protein